MGMTELLLPLRRCILGTDPGPETLLCVARCHIVQDKTKYLVRGPLPLCNGATAEAIPSCPCQFRCTRQVEVSTMFVHCLLSMCGVWGQVQPSSMLTQSPLPTTHCHHRRPAQPVPAVIEAAEVGVCCAEYQIALLPGRPV